MEDKSYLTKPSLMSDRTIEAIAQRIAEHCKTHNLPRIQVVFHGGEPLLAGISRIRSCIEKVRSAAPELTEVVFGVQTNGVLITEEWCDLFRTYDVKVGMSIDGPQAIHDRHRIDHYGNGSYASVLAGWRRLQVTGLEPSLLGVIDVSCSPKEMFEHVRHLNPSKADFLLPDGTHDKPPPNICPGGLTTIYADWMLSLFQIWIEAGSPFRIVTFEHIARKILGAADSFDAFGTERNNVLVFETDGAIEPIDVLKACKHGLTQTKFNVHSHSIDEAFADEMIDLYHRSGELLCARCVACDARSICGGGYLPHRFSTLNGFNNPSVYCRDLIKLISTIQNWVLDQLPPAVISEANLKYLRVAGN